MKLKDIAELTNAEIICGEDKLNDDVQCCFACDLMSDVLTLKANDLLLITGLVNLQSVRTAEMSDIQYLMFVRNKELTPDIIELAKENGMLLMRSPYSMFKTAGLLYTAGLEPLF